MMLGTTVKYNIFLYTSKFIAWLTKESTYDVLLSLAADLGDIDLAKYALKNNADINSKSCVANSPTFYHTVKSGNMDIIKFFIENGADVNAVDENGYTALLYAVKRGNLTVIELILKNTDINFKESGGLTALSIAVALNKLDVAKLLLENGAIADCGTVGRNTHLCYSAGTGNLDMVCLLLQHEADVNAKDAKGYTALDYAASAGNIAISKLLLDNSADVNSNVNLASTLYSLAIEETDSLITFYTPIIRLLVERGMKITPEQEAQLQKLGLPNSGETPHSMQHEAPLTIEDRILVEELDI